jgi:hypothetical protein
VINPRRVLALLAVFLVVAAAYFLLTWRESRKELAEKAARQLYQVKEAEITALTLKKGADAIHLAKEGETWQITAPIAAKADQPIVQSILATLASLSKDRDLGQAQDLKPYGLDNPSFIAEFTADDRDHRLAVGEATPGKQGYYALRDQEETLLIIAALDKESLDRPLAALRDKTIFAFTGPKVKTLSLNLGSHQVELERTGPAHWQWPGREGFKVRSDRVESLLRRLELARMMDFIAEAPGAKDLAAFDLEPKPKGKMVLEAEGGRETLLLGADRPEGVLARKGADGPVFLVEKRLAQDLEQTLAGLEDRRLWSGDTADVRKVAWGPPAALWTATPEGKGWRLTRDKESLTRGSVHLEYALQKFQDLEYARTLPAAAPPEGPAYLVELRDAAGQLIFRLAQVGKPEKDRVEVSLERQGAVERALILLQPYQRWQEDMVRLTKEPGTE